MHGAEALVWWLCFAIAVNDSVRAVDHSVKDFKNSNETLQFDISRGISLHVSRGQANVTVRMSCLLKGNEIESKDAGRLKFKSDALKKIGMAMMMGPVLMQLMSLPGTLASIKFSLLRSIIVGKLALLIILYNFFKNSQKSEVVVVHKPEYHDHYYPSYHQPEDDDEGWLGR